MQKLIALMLIAGLCIGLQPMETEVEGYVFDLESEEEISEALINVYFQGELLLEGIISDDNGKFEFSLPENGTYIIEASKEGYKSGQVELAVVEEGPIEISIGLEAEE